MSRKLHDWDVIQKFHDKGHGFVECSLEFGFTHTAWNKAIKRGKLRSKLTRFPDRRRRYDWAEVQAYYDGAHSYRECKAAFGFCSAAWDKAVKRGEVRTRPCGMPIAELLSNPKRNRTHVKSRLLKAQLLENRCEKCGLVDWLGESLRMHLDHVNGVKDDNRLENLRMLCPNCHSQTPTYSGRNLKRGKLQGALRPV